MNEDIARVTESIAPHVTAFISEHLNREFHVADLHNYVSAQVGGYIAPASSDRILRQLRQKGRLNYIVTDRSKSLYRAIPLEGQLF